MAGYSPPQTPENQHPDTPHRVLLACVNFPSAHEAADGQGLYVLRVASALATLGQEVQVCALRMDEQPAVEVINGIQVERVPLPQTTDVFGLYAPGQFRPAMMALQRGLERRLQVVPPAHTTLWAHGYELGDAAARARGAGHPVVGVMHYSVAIESLHDLAMADDPVRRRAFGHRGYAALARAAPPAMRPTLVRQTLRSSALGSALPLPPWVALQLKKLHMEHQLMSSSHRVVAVGEHFARELACMHPRTAGAIGVCHAGTPPVLPAPAWPLPERPDALRLVMAGRPTGQKGWDYAMEALHRLEAQRPDLASRLDLVVLGGLGAWGGPYSAYGQRVADRLRALRFVRWHAGGHVPHDHVLAALGAAHGLLFPSVFEPFGLVLLEAMCCGCLVLASDAAGPLDLLHAPWGLRMPFQQPTNRVDTILSNLVDLLVLSPAEWKRRGSLARHAARAYTWERCAQAHAACLQEARALAQP